MVQTVRVAAEKRLLRLGIDVRGQCGGMLPDELMQGGCKHENGSAFRRWWECKNSCGDSLEETPVDARAAPGIEEINL